MGRLAAALFVCLFICFERTVQTFEIILGSSFTHMEENAERSHGQSVYTAVFNLEAYDCI